MYTFSGSFASVTSVCVWEPRQVWTFVISRGFAMSLMSKIRIPRIRSGLAVSGIGSVPQSMRLLKSSTDAKSRSP